MTYMFLGTLGLAIFFVLIDLFLTIFHNCQNNKRIKKLKKLTDFKYEQEKILRVFERQ